MKFLYATSIKYPSLLANRIQVLSMSKAFSSLMSKDFYLGGNEIKADLPYSTIVNFGVKKSWKLGWKVLLFARKEKIEVIYCREARLLFFIAFYNFLFFRLPLQYGYEVHALLGRSMIDYFTDGVLRFFVDRHFFLTHELRKIYCKKYRIKEIKTAITPDAVDLSIFDIPISKEDARKRVGLSSQGKIIGYSGRFTTLTMDKGINDILEALKLLPPDVSFTAVGGTEDDREVYRKKALELGVAERVQLLGHVTQPNLALWQKAFDILLMPFPWQNHYAYYMSPLKLFEYLAAERPIIASDLPSIREILNEKNSLLVPPNSPVKIAEAVLKIFDDPEFSQKISRSAYADSKRYTWDNRAKQIVEVFTFV